MARPGERGLTLIDLLVAIAGAFVGLWIVIYFKISPYPAVRILLGALVGVGFWLVVFLWLVPGIVRLRAGSRGDHDDAS